ncbi:copper/zinc superoxide dismutase (SODC) [Jatrophihabitans sp. GAS493]|uniref:CHRD domain-containing protein n=1 Tax=Jatrophihabitans sp. GAS493 TaxID=1907575 RepID=UPI000BBFE67D|nr:CHRD domain-containing protein [Jatrophihabitans sp. GAS493]SOD74997.1 copper/zinc superoxide dismutase (SODC) [Jatrophihabitans sp. GAS493]
MHGTVEGVDTLAGPLPAGARFLLRLGLYGGDSHINAVAAEPIAFSGDLTGAPLGSSFGLHPVSVDPNGNSTGMLAGSAAFRYDPAAQTVTVTVNATGLTPGQHAAHIHSGSCVDQGAPIYMLADLTADQNGNIVDQTRTITGVTSPPATGWYLNLHQGDSNSILVNGQPALSFRPLLCTNLPATATMRGTTPKQGSSMPSGMASSPSSQAPTSSPSSPSPSDPTISSRVVLGAQPVGTVRVGVDEGRVSVRVDVSGLTPGSVHTAQIVGAGSTRPIVRLQTVTADGSGQVHGTVEGVDTLAGPLPAGARFLLRLGLYGGDSHINAVAAEPIAFSGDLTGAPLGSSFGLHPVSVDPNGNSTGMLAGSAAFRYDPAAQTVTVTVNATGLTPGQHAAHIHSGSCVDQGAPIYMLADLTADQNGNIVDQTRTITGVTSPPATGWYLNLHQGDSNSILVNGQPALSFRPLLCTNLPTTGGAA